MILPAWRSRAGMDLYNAEHFKNRFPNCLNINSMIKINSFKLLFMPAAARRVIYTMSQIPDAILCYSFLEKQAYYLTGDIEAAALLQKIRVTSETLSYMVNRNLLIKRKDYTYIKNFKYVKK